MPVDFLNSTVLISESLAAVVLLRVVPGWVLSLITSVPESLVRVNSSLMLLVSLVVSVALALKIVTLFTQETNLAVFMTSPLLMLALALVFTRSGNALPNFLRQKV